MAEPAGLCHPWRMTRQAARQARLAETLPRDPGIAADWDRVRSDLDAQGCAVVGPLLTADACAAVAALYAHDAPFRSRVIMARHGFGRGEYKYFAYPLPEVVAALRTALYPPLAVIANRWNAAMGSRLAIRPSTRPTSRVAMPPARLGRRRCCCSTARATTTACTRISMASMCFRCRRPCCCRGRAPTSPAASSC